MRFRITLLSAILTLVALPVLAQDGARSASLFLSGLRIDDTTEWLSGDEPPRGVRSWAGAAGIGLEQRIARRTTIEISAEYRRDIGTTRPASRCGYYQNTCYLAHRIEITSLPIVLLARFTMPASHRVALFGSAGLRYVATPAAHDVSGPSLLPVPFDTSERMNPEVGAGVAWRASPRLWLFADGRALVGDDGAPWDPRRRLNAGVRIRY